MIRLNTVLRDNFSGSPLLDVRRVARHASRVTVLAITLLTVACSSSPPHLNETSSRAESRAPSLGSEIALRALAQVGKPYRYGGADLNGFDCSGLVFFIHRELGVTVPRTAAEQYAASQPVNVRRLEPGDLLFFRTTKKKVVSHVAIYAGEGRFVHSPQSGRAIELRTLDDDYYGPRLVGAGRLASNSN